MPVELNFPSKSNKKMAPSTRFHGSKRKLLPWMKSVFEDLEFTTAIDLMSGTSTVAFLLKSLGVQVTTNDYLRFNYLTGHAFVENSQYKIDETDLQWILGTHNDVEYCSFVTDTFDGYYFVKQENEWIDRAICNINTLEGVDNPATLAKRAIATHSLIQACLMKRPFNLFHRKNLNLRLADVGRTFGNLTTWETPFPSLFKRIIEESNTHIFDNNKNNSALNQDAVNLSDKSMGLVYLDPPYFGISRDPNQSNYRFTYHFVEGLAQYDKWAEMIDPESKLKALKPNGNSSEDLYRCPKSELRTKVLDWMKSIVDNWPNSQIVLSYKHPSILSVYSLKKVLEDSGRKVSVRRASYRYALNHRNGKPDENEEILFVAN